MAKQQLALPHFPWLMVQNVSIVANAVEANVFPFAKLKICKPACVTQLQIPAKDAAEWYNVLQSFQKSSINVENFLFRISILPAL